MLKKAETTFYPNYAHIAIKSIRFYRDLRPNAETFIKLSACFIGALQALHPNASFSTEIALKYANAVERSCSNNPLTKKEVQLLTDEVLTHMGVGRIDKLRLIKTKTALDFLLRRLRNSQQGCLMVVSKTDHIVALKPVDGGWQIDGFYPPVDSNIVLTSDQVFRYLFVPEKSKKNKYKYNIIVFKNN